MEIYRKLILLLAIGILAGCVSFKLNPKLDTGFSEKGQEFANQTQLVFKGQAQSQDDSVSESIKNKFANGGEQKLSVLSIKKKYPRAQGFQCFEPYLFVLTFGIVPVVCEQEYEIESQWQNTKDSETKTTVLERKSILGWAALIMPLFPRWSFGYTSAQESLIYTEINSRAETESL